MSRRGGALKRGKQGASMGGLENCPQRPAAERRRRRHEDTERSSQGGPVSIRIDPSILRGNSLAEAIMPPSDNPERIAWFSGRLAGLAGTVRYDLSDEDREVLREVSRLLEGASLTA